jgi:hypothetical protein
MHLGLRCSPSTPLLCARVKGVVIILAGHKRPLPLPFASSLQSEIIVTQELLVVKNLPLSSMGSEPFVGTQFAECTLDQVDFHS